MKYFSSVMLLIVSFSSAAAIVEIPSNTTVISALQSGSCSIVVKNKPVVFLRGETDSYLGHEVSIRAKNADHNNVRQLPVGREIKVSGFLSGNVLTLKDNSVKEFLSLGTPLDKVTVSEFEDLTSQRLTLKCEDDEPVDF